jgi:hypothetical protein
VRFFTLTENPPTVRSDVIVVMVEGLEAHEIYGRISLQALMGWSAKLINFPPWMIRSEEIVVDTAVSSHDI